ncbi:hypothetical protein PHYBOEH_001553 [Phytophthora boehmeriae]|uniref:RxLR effector protein n=1 Tax=Phytophthora boehmeriae TaxID=109152 RepID=A0A8T1WYW4_9STRA|nr:hypothetical protein PHYBOEH_001553 [Phytophthora boehmeriae]
MRICYVLLMCVAALLADSCAAISKVSDSSTIKLSEEALPNSALLVHSLTARDNIIRRRSLRGFIEDDENNENNTPTKVSATKDDDDEERVVSKADLMSALRITEGDAKVLRGILKNKTPEHILTKLNAPFKYVNGIKVYPKNSPQYEKYLFYVKYARDELPPGMFQ